MQSPHDDTNVDDTDQKTTAAITTTDVTSPKSLNIVYQDQQLSTAQKDRFNKSVIRLSTRRTLIECILTIPSFIVELYYGIHYSNQCPIQPLIIVFLIVHGCSSLANGIVLLTGFVTANYIKRSLTASSCARYLIVGSSIGQLILLIFSVVWLIVGQVWVFGAQVNGFQSSNSTQSATYCYSTVFWTGFAIIIITYAVWLIIIIVVVRQLIMKRLKAKKETAPNIDERT
jgi:hypothetical protein